MFIVTRLTPTTKGDKNSLYEAVKTQQNSEFTVSNLTKLFTKIEVSIVYWSTWYIVTVTWYNSWKSTTTFTEKLRTNVISRLTNLLSQCWFKEEKLQEQLSLSFNNIEKNFSTESKKMSVSDLYKLVNKIWSENWYLSFFSKDLLKDFSPDYNSLVEWNLVNIQSNKEKKILIFEYEDFFNLTLNIEVPLTSIFYFRKSIRLEILDKVFTKWKRTNQESTTRYTILTNTCNELQIKDKLEKLWIYSSTEVWCTWSFILTDIIDWKYKFIITKTDLPTD